VNRIPLIDDLIERKERHLVRLREAARREVETRAGDRLDLRRDALDFADEHGNDRRLDASDWRCAGTVPFYALEAFAAEIASQDDWSVPGLDHARVRLHRRGVDRRRKPRSDVICALPLASDSSSR